MTAEANRSHTLTAEPKELMNALELLDRARQDPSIEKQRRFKRFAIRGDARLEPMDENALDEPMTVLLRDISRGGVGFLCDRSLEPQTSWRLRFENRGNIVGAQPVIIRFSRLIQRNLYIAGGQFVLEPYLLSLAGVPESQLKQEEMARHDDHDTSDFLSPDTLG